MSGKALAALASGDGATEGTAKPIGEDLHGTGRRVDVLPLEKVRSLDGYVAVILEAAVFVGRGQKEAVA